MAYAVAQDMIDRFGEREVIALTDRQNVGDIDGAVLARGLEAADNEINPYLVKRYPLPLLPVPTIVRDFACDIARYRLCGGEVVETEEIRNRYRDAIKFFERVAAGQISLGLDPEAKEVLPAPQTRIKSAPPVFNRDKLGDFTC